MPANLIGNPGLFDGNAEKGWPASTLTCFFYRSSVSDLAISAATRASHSFKRPRAIPHVASLSIYILTRYDTCHANDGDTAGGPAKKKGRVRPHLQLWPSTRPRTPRPEKSVEPSSHRADFELSDQLCSHLSVSMHQIVDRAVVVDNLSSFRSHSISEQLSHPFQSSSVIFALISLDPMHCAITRLRSAQYWRCC